MAILTEGEFSKHVGTKFYAKLGESEVNLILAEVKSYDQEPDLKAKMERFSLFFDGPPDSFLPQGIFQMRHDNMGDFEVFLVPISGDQNGFRYEAVFNLYK